MASLITNLASPEASGEAVPGIVQTYKAQLQALGYSPSLTGKCIRTILHLIAWLSANGTGVETLDVRVLHRFLNHDCACPGPRGYRCRRVLFVPPPSGLLRGCIRGEFLCPATRRVVPVAASRAIPRAWATVGADPMTGAVTLPREIRSAGAPSA